VPRLPRLPAVAVLVAFLPALPLAGQVGDPYPVGREVLEELEFPPLLFDPPEAEAREVLGIPVLHLHDPTFPMVDIHVRVKGGFGLFPRDWQAPFTALPALLRSGGTRTLPPDSVNARVEFLALQMSFGAGGGAHSASLNVLTQNLDEALELWVEMLLEPDFHPQQVEVWRGQEEENVRRRMDDPSRLAFTSFNRLVFGDHPIGWEMEPEDLTPEHFSRERLQEAHRRIYCRDHLMVGVSGDAPWQLMRPRLERMLERWPPCPDTLPEAPPPEMFKEPGVYLIPRPLNQTTIVMAHPGGLRQEDSPEFFASRIADYILGGAGFSSRLLSRVRTERGYAYSASSLWTTPADYEGLVGALTQTRSEATIASVQTILEVMEEMRAAPPEEREVSEALSSLVNGFAFNFETPGQVVLRRMTYLALELREDWLERYLEQIQEVTADAVHQVVRKYLRPKDMMILLVGDPENFDLPPESLGPVTVLDVEGGTFPGDPGN